MLQSCWKGGVVLCLLGARGPGFDPQAYPFFDKFFFLTISCTTHTHNLTSFLLKRDSTYKNLNKFWVRIKFRLQLNLIFWFSFRLFFFKLWFKKFVTSKHKSLNTTTTTGHEQEHIKEQQQRTTTRIGRKTITRFKNKKKEW